MGVSYEHLRWLLLKIDLTCTFLSAICECQVKEYLENKKQISCGNSLDLLRHVFLFGSSNLVYVQKQPPEVLYNKVKLVGKHLWPESLLIKLLSSISGGLLLYIKVLPLENKN